MRLAATDAGSFMVKVLLVGVGRWGTNHLRVLTSLPVDLYVADLRDDHLSRARALGVPETHLATDPAKFVPRVDAAAVVIPGPAQAVLCRTLLSSGKDVFVEKPLALDPLEAKQLAELAEERGRILQVGHIFRFDPASQWLRAAIARGDFGRLRMLRGRFSGFKRPRADMGVSFSDAVHFVDLFNYLVGRAPVRVSAIVKDFLGRGLEDEAFIALDYDVVGNGTDAGAPALAGPIWATVESGYHRPGKLREIVVVGEGLTAVCDYNVAQYKVTTFRNEHVVKGGELLATEGDVRQLEFPPAEPLLAEWRAFLNSVKTRRRPLSDGWAGYDAVRVIAAALDSARTARPVELEPSAATSVPRATEGPRRRVTRRIPVRASSA